MQAVKQRQNPHPGSGRDLPLSWLFPAVPGQLQGETQGMFLTCSLAPRSPSSVGFPAELPGARPSFWPLAWAQSQSLLSLLKTLNFISLAFRRAVEMLWMLLCCKWDFFLAYTIAVAVCFSRSDTKPKLELLGSQKSNNLPQPQHILDVRFHKHRLKQGVLTLQASLKTACGCGTGFISSAASLTTLPS